MKIELTKLTQKINELNSLIDFVEINELDLNKRNRYIGVLRYQKAIVRDMDKKGRKIPENTPIVCERYGLEVNSIREKEPPFKLEVNIGLGGREELMNIIEDEIPHNSYTHLLNNYSLKAVKKMLGRKIVLEDLNGIKDNILLIMESFKHRNYYKKYIDINSFEKQLDNICEVVDSL